jgi:hypothetical protein
MISFDAQGFFGIFQDLEEDLSLLANILQDSSFVEELRVLVATNFDRVWGSQGSNIGSDWNGNDLYETGRLKLSLTTPGNLNLQIIGETVLINSSVSYARYVNDRYVFFGVDDTFDAELTQLIERYLSQRGKLTWQ